MLMATARQQQQQHGNSLPSGSGSEHKKMEIYRYSAPWQLYGMNWSVRPDRRFRIAVGSFIEDYSNKVCFHCILYRLLVQVDIQMLRLIACFLGSLALGKHLVQALPCVYALQFLTGKVDNHDVC